MGDAATIEKTLDAKLEIETVPLKLYGDKDVLAWRFPMPAAAGYKNLKRQLYLSIVNGDHILMLNSVQTHDIIEEKVIRQLMWNTMSTIRLQP